MLVSISQRFKNMKTPPSFFSVIKVNNSFFFFQIRMILKFALIPSIVNDQTEEHREYHKKLEMIRRQSLLKFEFLSAIIGNFRGTMRLNPSCNFVLL